MVSSLRKAGESVEDITFTSLGFAFMGLFLSILALEEVYRRYSGIRAKVSRKLKPVPEGCERHVTEGFDQDSSFIIKYPRTGKPYLFHLEGLDRASLLGEVVKSGRVYVPYVIHPGDFDNPLGGARTGGRTAQFWDYVPIVSEENITLPKVSK